MKRIVLLTGYERFFGQTRKPWISMNVDVIRSLLTENGYDVQEYEFSDVVNKDIDIRNSIVFYTFSQRENLRRFIFDTIDDLHHRGNIVIPAFELLRCHENKGNQLLYTKRTGFSDLWSVYFSSKREIARNEIPYPVVFKTLDGSNGRGVHLVRNERELITVIRKLEKSLGFENRLDLIRRRLFRQGEHFPGYPELTGRQNYLAYKDYIQPEIPFILQRFIPNLMYDYRVIVLGEKYYVIKRMVRDHDFRASGAKKFVFAPDIDPAMLDYARGIFNKVQSPFLSLDIGSTDEGYCLFEFQALHFGINAIKKSKGYYRNDDGAWSFVESEDRVENSIAEALVHYLETMGQDLWSSVN